ncbi:MAG: VOC family protein [Pseudomonadota bacterium]
MAHMSRLGTIVFDCKNENLDKAASFWAGALGLVAEPEVAGYPNYRNMVGPDREPKMLLQNVEHEPRVHIDIETDDKDAECARLQSLGAHIVNRVDEPGKDWIIMEAPTGHRLCLVKPQRADFEENANRWGEE